MGVQMEDGLSGIAASVEDDTVATGVDSRAAGDLGAGKEEGTCDLSIFGSQASKARDRLARDHQDMSGGLGLDIAKCNDELVFVEPLDSELTAGNLAKNRIFHRLLL